MRKVKSEERNEGKEGRFARQNDKRQKSGGDLRLASNDEGRKEGKELSLSVCLSVLPPGLLSLKQVLPSLNEDEEDGIWKPGRKLHVHSPLVDHVPLDFRS